MNAPFRPVTGGVTLGWLLARADLGLELLSGPDPSGVEVSWAHAVELIDPTPWLQGGELVLTTGLRLPRSVAGLTAYVHRLADAGVAALGFGVGLEYAEVPRAMLRACADAGLPLVVVPFPTPFLAIIRSIADHAAEQQTADLHSAVAFQQQLTRSALEHGVPGLVDALARKLSGPAVVLDDLGSTLASSGADRDLLDRVRAEVETPASRVVPGETATLMLLRLADGRRTQGWLAVETPRPATSQERLLIGQVASMLTLQLSRSADLSALHADLAAAAADLALAGTTQPLARFGLEDEVRVVVATSTRGYPIRADELAEALERVPHVCTTRDGNAVALVPGTFPDASLDGLVRGFGDRRDIVIGAGRELGEATRAAAAARATHRAVVTYESLQLEALLDDEAVRARVVGLAGTRLAALLASDRPAHRDLIESLRAFLETNGSWEAASRRLTVHRHTLRQRIARVESETGLDLDAAHTRAATLLVLLAHDRPDNLGADRRVT